MTASDEISANKYFFKPYDSSFPILFEQEKRRLKPFLSTECRIDHVGSTAVPGLGGKGIIDILISSPKSLLKETSQKLREAGYTFVEGSSTKGRLFHHQDLSDQAGCLRRYHIHLTFYGSTNQIEMLAFRDYLRNHPEVVRRYSDTKREAAEIDDVNKESYMIRKEPILQEILRAALAEFK